MKTIIEFLFFRWKVTIYARGEEKWITYLYGCESLGKEHLRNFIDYKYTNKFDGSEKIKRKYLN